MLEIGGMPFFQAREFGLVKSRESRPEDSPMVFCRQGGYRDVCVRARETRLEAFMNGWDGPYFRG